MSEDTPGNLTVIWGKVKVVLPWAVVAAIGTAIGYLALPKDDDQTVRQDIKALDAKFDAKITVVDDKLDKVATSVARIEGQLQTRVEKPSRPKYANGDE